MVHCFANNGAIDSDDLLEDPHSMVEIYCNAVGIPYMKKALSWEPGARDEVSWWDAALFMPICVTQTA
ncbi:MAG: hypothetical protein AAF633_16160 [Chloroflexota bacterium]